MSGERNGGRLGADARQARADHGRRQQPLDRLGHRQGLPRPGADLAFTYQGDALKKRVEPLAEEVDGIVVGHCDVTEPATIDAVFAAVERPGARSISCVHAIAFSDKDQLDGRYVDTTADNFTMTMLISLLFVHRRRPARREADDARRLDADADLLRRRKMDAALQRHGRRQGRA